MFKFLSNRKSQKIYGIFSTLGLFASIISAFFAFYSTPDLKGNDIQNSIDQLDDIKTSLNKLSQYVSDQKTGLEDLSKSLKEMNQKKETLEKIISIKAEEVQALLEFQASQQTARLWIERGISFLIGFFSSLTVHYFVTIRKKT